MLDLILLGDLDLMDPTAHFILPGTLDMRTPGQIAFTLMFVGATPEDRIANENAVQQTLNMAAIRSRQQDGDWVSLEMARMTGAHVYFDVLRGTLAPGEIGIGGLYSQADITLTTLPYARGESYTLSAAQLLQARSLSDTGWSATRATFASGTLTEDTTASATHEMSQSASPLAGATTFSLLAKAAGRTQLALALLETPSFTSRGFATFDLTTGTVVGGTVGTVAITAAGGGWWRVSVAGSLVGAGASLFVSLASGGTTTYSGGGVSGVQIASAQIASDTLTNGDPGILVTDVPGDCPEGALFRAELDDVSSSGAVNRVWFGRYSGMGLLAVSDADPWVNATALTGASTTTDATAYGGSYVARTATGTTAADLARAVMPAGALNKGRRDVWARVNATGTAMSAPGSPTMTKSEATAITTTSRDYMQIEFGATGFAAYSGLTILPAWSVPTTAGSLLLCGVDQLTTGGIPSSPTTPSGGWKRLIDVSLADDAAVVPRYGRMTIYYLRNAASQSGTVTINGANSGVAWLLELKNGDAIAGYATDQSTTDTTQPTMVLTDQKIGFPNTLELALIEAWKNTGTDDNTDFPWNGYLPIPDISGGPSVAMYQIIPDAGGDAPIPKVDLLASAASWIAALLHVKPKVNFASLTSYQEPLPGLLPAGTYGAMRVQAVDAFGNRSNASSSAASVTLTNANGSLTASWTAPTGDLVGYIVTLQAPGPTYYEFETGSTATSYTITDLAAGERVAGLPATTGAIAPAPRLIPRIGTTGQASSDLTTLDEVVLPTGGWRMVRVITGREFPPQSATMDGERADWAAEVQMRSANGLSAIVQLDALWMVPHDQPVAEVWKDGLTLATKRRWIIESHRSGRGVIVRTENITTGAITETLSGVGAPTLASGMDSILALMLEQAGGASAIGTAQLALRSLTIWPRYRWGSGNG